MGLFGLFRGWPLRHPRPDAEDVVSEPEETPQPPRTRCSPRVPATRGVHLENSWRSDANLQEFAQRVAYVRPGDRWEDQGRRSASADQWVLYEELARTHQGLGIGEQWSGVVLATPADLPTSAWAGAYVTGAGLGGLDAKGRSDWPGRPAVLRAPHSTVAHACVTLDQRGRRVTTMSSRARCMCC